MLSIVCIFVYRGSLPFTNFEKEEVIFSTVFVYFVWAFNGCFVNNCQAMLTVVILYLKEYTNFCGPTVTKSRYTHDEGILSIWISSSYTKC